MTDILRRMRPSFHNPLLSRVQRRFSLRVTASTSLSSVCQRTLRAHSRLTRPPCPTPWSALQMSSVSWVMKINKVNSSKSLYSDPDLVDTQHPRSWWHRDSGSVCDPGEGPQWGDRVPGGCWWWVTLSVTCEYSDQVISGQMEATLGCCCFKQGPISLNVKIPKSGFVSGETAKVNVKVRTAITNVTNDLLIWSSTF